MYQYNHILGYIVRLTTSLFLISGLYQPEISADPLFLPPDFGSPAKVGGGLAFVRVGFYSNSQP